MQSLGSSYNDFAKFHTDAFSQQFHTTKKGTCHSHLLKLFAGALHKLLGWVSGHHEF